MLFTDMKDYDLFCKKYGFSAKGGVSRSNKYPFIMLVHNQEAGYKDNIDVFGDGSSDRIEYEVKASKYKDWLINHRSIGGIYHSIFLFYRCNTEFYCMGEYCFINNEGNIFIFDKIREANEADEKVYYVEEVTDEEIIYTELGDRNHVIDGIYNDTEIRISKTNDLDIVPGDYLDKNFYRIDLGRIIDLKIESINPRFVMGKETSQAEQRVAHQLFLLYKFNTSIIKEVKDEEALTEGLFTEAILYTVNVGCGLTNFMVVKKNEKTEVWVFDWGSGKGYKKEAKTHIKDCLADIRGAHFSGNSFIISKIFISHGDADHYNRIDERFIDSTTEIWTSGYHLVAGQYLNKLKKIQGKGPKFYMQLACNSNNGINILHPKHPIVFLPPRAMFYGTGYYLARDKNNVSPIIELNLNCEKCLFPGDIMQVGWNWFYTDTGSSAIDTTVYIHTHHGSKNGFITNIPTVGNSEYDMVTCEIDILSSRDNAYPGTIPSVDIQSRAEYANTYKTQVPGREIKYYKTNLLSHSIVPVYV